MLEFTIAKEELSSQIYPFHYDGALILENRLQVKDQVYEGLYGFKNNALFFISYEFLPDELTLKIPETQEELHDFWYAVDFILQRLFFEDTFYIPDLATLDNNLDKLNFETVAEPFIRRLENIEKNINIKERLKYVSKKNEAS